MIPTTVDVGVGRRLRRVVGPVLRQAAATPGADRYRKHFSTHSHLQMLLLHVLDGAPSLRQTHAKLSGLGFGSVGLTQPISRSQFARSSTSRPLAPVERVFTTLVRRARATVPAAVRDWQHIHLVDSTFLRLSAACSPWSAYGAHTPGVRIHVGFDLAAAIPTDFQLTLADTHDLRALAERNLAPYVDWTLVMDRGYYGHHAFTRLRTAGVHFIVRQHEQARITLLVDRPLGADAAQTTDRVIADQLVTVGSPNHRASTVVPKLRLVTSLNQTGAPLRLLTDRFDLPASMVVALYRKRWQIELFFRWLKHYLGLLRPLGVSPEAVWLTVLLLAIVAILIMLLEPDRPAAVTRVAWLRTLAMLLPQAINSS